MNVTDDEQLYLLAKQPSSTISTFQGYEINGNTFYTFAQDKKSTNQNSGVRFDAEDDNGNKVTYYGYIEEIWELDYGTNFKVPLFRCKWFNLKDGVQVDPQYGMTTMDLKNLGYDTEPFVLARQHKDYLDACSEGSFTSKEVEARWDLLDRIEDNAEGWENDKGYADKPPFKPLPPREGNEEKEEKKKKKKTKKKKKENKKKEEVSPRI
ncbi:hypothetical protein QYE76_026798 [Lolium multiflorum]|uniref:DUF4216 domain-containing protein n=1 Tax=Lolium multiflorum TaxID=4521 RepID=A0AAD8RII9_LOLMU|nr:hypothetical protein QYE76_026798 [Lolium multiflorum]